MDNRIKEVLGFLIIEILILIYLPWYYIFAPVILIILLAMLFIFWAKNDIEKKVKQIEDEKRKE